MHYGIVGAGPIGLLFAAKLQDAGYKTSLLIKQENESKIELLKNLEFAGLYVGKKSIDKIYKNYADFLSSGVNVILMCTKATSNNSIIDNIKMLDADKRIQYVICQNGIGVEDYALSEIGKERVLRVVLNIGCKFLNQSKLKLTFSFKNYISSNSSNLIAKKICYDFSNSGLCTDFSLKFEEEVFKKCVINSALSYICALTKLNMGLSMKDAGLKSLVEKIIIESMEVGKGIGYDLESTFKNESLAYLAKGGDHIPSLALDIMSNRVTENEYHAGAILRIAENLDIRVPVIETVYLLIKAVDRNLGF